MLLPRTSAEPRCPPSRWAGRPTSSSICFRAGGAAPPPLRPLLAQLCDAEAALVVNNNAAAVLLVLASLAQGREVLVSRGESVEIGGGFRVPEVMEQSGARLVDVGTTNRTRLADYERALHRPEADGPRPQGAPVELPGRGLRGGHDDGRAWPPFPRGCPSSPTSAPGLLDAACPWLETGPPPWLKGEPAARQTLASGPPS